MELTEFKAELEGMKEATLAALKEQKSYYDDRLSKLDANAANYPELKSGFEKYAGMLDKQAGRIDEMYGLLNRPGLAGGRAEEKTLGQIIIENPALADLKAKSGTKGSGFVSGIRATIPIPDLLFKAIYSSNIGNATPGILTADRVPGIVKPGIPRTRVRDLIPRFTTENNTVEFVKENAFTNNASPQYAEGSLKAESQLTFTIDSAPVRTLAHYIRTSRQILDDFKALQAYIDQRMGEGLKDEEDRQLLTGDGVGTHLSGLVAESTAYDTARNVTGDTKIDVINHAISQIEDVNLYPSGIVLHPRDWRAMQLVKDGASNVGNYILAGPVSNASPMLWGLPVATATQVTVGKFFVGAFSTMCAVWDRMDARVDISTEDQDNFIRNMVTIRAEERLAFTVYNALGFIYGSLPATVV